MTVAKIFNGIKMVSEKYRVTQKSFTQRKGRRESYSWPWSSVDHIFIKIFYITREKSIGIAKCFEGSCR